VERCWLQISKLEARLEVVEGRVGWQILSKIIRLVSFFGHS